MTLNEKNLAKKISLQGMCINLLLFIIKGIAAIMINSVSLLSDAIHSLTDIISTLVVLIGLKISTKPADREHPYGHERIECVIALLLGIMLFAIGGIISYEGYSKIKGLNSINYNSTIFNFLAITTTVISIIAKEWMYRFTICCAKKINSPSMAADAWHHRSDAISSIGSFIGVMGIYLGYPIIDIVACFVISIFIFNAALNICKDACYRIIDTACDNKIIEQITAIILENPEVIAIDLIRSRVFGSKIYIDIEVTLSGNITFKHSHEIAHYIRDVVHKSSDMIKDCTVHVNPSI